MILYILLIALLAQQGLKLHFWSFNEDYLSKASTDAVRGIFILLIIASHFVTYVAPLTDPLDIPYLWLRGALGQGVVVCFLFYSGYGIALSAKQKGDSYVRAMPVKRIFHTLLIYDCSQILFLLLQMSMGRQYNFKDFLSAFLAWGSFGNDNWYIFVILGLYLITWFVLRGQKLNAITAARISIAVLTFLLALKCAGKHPRWCDTLLCYPMGIWFCLYKDKIDHFLVKNSHYYLTAFAVGMAFVLAHKVWNYSLLLYSLTMLLFGLCVVLLTMKIQLQSPVLIYCGRHLQGLFLLHRIPFIILRKYFPHSGPGVYAYFALSIVVSFFLEAIFSKAVTFLWGDSSSNA